LVFIFLCADVFVYMHVRCLRKIQAWCRYRLIHFYICDVHLVIRFL
jgi:hypothetical protein